MKSYSELFEERGSSYDRAMRLAPQARRAEFAQLVQAASPVPGSVIADVPAGGGYFRSHLPDGCEWVGHEPCASFTNHGSTALMEGMPLVPLPWSDGAIDITVSLAGVHHLEDKTPLFAEVSRVTRRGGRFVLSDVLEGSPVARFLDDFVGLHNSTGHEGSYLSSRTFAELRKSGWEPTSAAEQKFNWEFSSKAEMAEFARLLFDMSSALDESTLIQAIESRLGVVDLPGEKVGMNWSLLTITSIHR